LNAYTLGSGGDVQALANLQVVSILHTYVRGSTPQGQKIEQHADNAIKQTGI